MRGIDKTDLITEFTCGSDHRAEKAALQLAAAGSQSLEILSELIDNRNPDIRWWATRSLAEIHTAEAIHLLLKSLYDPEPEVRQCAALALRGQPHAETVPHLIHSLSASDRLLARLAGDALIAIGGDAVPPLIAVMDDSSQPARLEAARALAVIGDTRAIPVLFKVFEGDSAIMEHWAEKGLEKMGVGTVFFEP
jgi:HEAT repeat protein